MNINPSLNQPYHGRIVQYALLPQKPAKVYFGDLIGRDPSAKYEWKASGGRPEGLLTIIDEALRTVQHPGVPHIVVAFPHLTSVFRFGDPGVLGERETSQYLVGRLPTSRLKERRVIGPPQTDEVGCRLEVHILEEEGRFWDQAGTVEEYLSKSVDIGTWRALLRNIHRGLLELFCPEIRVENPNKLREMLEKAA